MLHISNSTSVGSISSIKVETVTLPKMASRSKLQFFLPQLPIFIKTFLFIQTLDVNNVKPEKKRDVTRPTQNEATDCTASLSYD